MRAPNISFVHLTSTVWQRPRQAQSQRVHPVEPASGRVQEFHRALPGFVPTSLLELPDAAHRLGIARLFVKYEDRRLDVDSFKILGTTWATFKYLTEYLEVEPKALLDAIASGRPSYSRNLCLVAASDGNHGHALAHTARLIGVGSHIILPSFVPADLIGQIESEGASIQLHAGSYDAAVTQARAFAAEDPTRVLIQDTAWPGYEEVPGWIVDGYSTLFEEADQQLSDAGSPPPTAVFVPVGVGSLAQAAISHYQRGLPDAPTIVSVEPDAAAGVLESLRRGTLVTVPTGMTAMNGLNCGTPSFLAWPYLRDGVGVAVTVTDEVADDAIRTLFDFGIPTRASGAAAFAGLEELSRIVAGLPLGDELVGSHTIALVLVTEGARRS